MEAIGQSLRFDYGAEAEKWLPLANGIDGTILSTDMAGASLELTSVSSLAATVYPVGTMRILIISNTSVYSLSFLG